MRKIFFAVIATLFVILNLSSFDVKAESSTPDYIDSNKARLTAEKYLTMVAQNSFENWKEAKLKEPISLYDFDDNLTSYLFEVMNKNGTEQGYIIVSALKDFPGVMESTREGSSPYNSLVKDSLNKDKNIYVGPLLHFKKTSNEKIIDLQQNKVLNSTELKSKGLFNKQDVKKMKIDESTSISSASITDYSYISPTSITDYSYKLISNVPDIAWYRGCAPTTGANIIRYWDNNGYSNLIQSTTTNSHVIDVLADQYMFTDSQGGTLPSNFVSGIRKYMNDRGYSPTISTGSTFAFHKTQMNSGKPDKLGTSNHPVWGNHAVTGVGYEEYYDTSSLGWNRMVIVHDTWDNTVRDYWITWSSYFSNVVSISM